MSMTVTVVDYVEYLRIRRGRFQIGKEPSNSSPDSQPKISAPRPYKESSDSDSES